MAIVVTGWFGGSSTAFMRHSDLFCFTSGYFREMIRSDIRRARERYNGAQLSRELTSIQQRLDSVTCLSLDIVMNFLLAYRDAQVSRVYWCYQSCSSGAVAHNVS